jgi:ABC-type nitrate/sulfonate/bicarbonate transport system ATPase subunit
MSFEQVAFQFSSRGRRSTLVVSDINFTVESGEVIGIMGESGSGKSTLLRLAAGLIHPLTGRVRVQGDEPEIGFLFQENVLLPWRTVGENLQYPLENIVKDSEEREARARQTCAEIRLSPEIYWSRYPAELSGGERRRLAIGMAIVRPVDLLLLDEPTTHLDDKNKWLFHELIQEIFVASHAAVVVVTHDLNEAITLSDQLLILDGGHIADAFKIALDRPRSRALRDSAAFSALHRNISERLAQLWGLDRT